MTWLTDRRERLARDDQYHLQLQFRCWCARSFRFDSPGRKRSNELCGACSFEFRYGVLV